MADTINPNVFIWNIDREHQEFFADELKVGRLRQGWGYDDRLDLRLIRQKADAGTQLDNEEAAAWNRLNVMIRGIKNDDIVLVKNTPTWGYYTIVQVVGGYEYDRGGPRQDYRHLLPVSILKSVNKLSQPVTGDLRTSIDRAMWPITLAIKRQAEILRLLELPDSELSQPVKWQVRIIDAHSPGFVALVRDTVIPKLSPTEFEQLIKELLDLLKFEDTKITAGPFEKGADVVMSINAPLFDDLSVVVQIKHHHPQDNDIESVDQLRRAFESYKAIAGLLVTSAATLGPDLQKAIEKLQTEGKTVRVLYGEELYRLILRLFE